MGSLGAGCLQGIPAGHSAQLVECDDHLGLAEYTHLYSLRPRDVEQGEPYEDRQNSLSGQKEHEDATAEQNSPLEVLTYDQKNTDDGASLGESRGGVVRKVIAGQPDN